MTILYTLYKNSSIDNQQNKDIRFYINWQTAILLPPSSV